MDEHLVELRSRLFFPDELSQAPGYCDEYKQVATSVMALDKAQFDTLTRSLDKVALPDWSRDALLARVARESALSSPEVASAMRGVR